jgi:hypothetical protein
MFCFKCRSLGFVLKRFFQFQESQPRITQITRIEIRVGSPAAVVASRHGGDMAEEPVRCDCPGRGVYLHGEGKRVDASGNTELAIYFAIRDSLRINQAREDAEAKQDAAFAQALHDGDAACKPGKGSCRKCEAWFRKLPIGEPFIRQRKVADDDYRATAFYDWEIEVDCRCVSREAH